MSVSHPYLSQLKKVLLIGKKQLEERNIKVQAIVEKAIDTKASLDDRYVVQLSRLQGARENQACDSPLKGH